MCGRFSLTSDREALSREFGLEMPVVRRLRPRYNIAPSQPVFALVRESGKLRPDILNWGFIPSWARDPSPARAVINARAETAAEKPMFRGAFRSSRCLIPADGFYEWKREGRDRVPWYFRLRSGGPFAFAGLAGIWQGRDGSEIRSCAILTTVPNGLVRPFHNRMPVILDRRGRDIWMDPGPHPRGEIESLLGPFPEDAMTAWPVSPHVNSPRHDDARCIEPVPSRN